MMPIAAKLGRGVTYHGGWGLTHKITGQYNDVVLGDHVTN